ncbi:MAG TPA: Rne/Rng family ribonuclease [Polyangiaceae bacterium]|jgi:ribonuclease G|nr:Rne/Rng family ribonuclease [Polyangiaceae bacterium]
MARNILVINVDLRETRVALIENGVIAELQVERAAHRGSVGNIVLGKVTRVLPGMQAAFIDIGMERAAFLHVEDLIRPDDFEAYLAGGGTRSNEDGDEPIRGDQARRADYAGRPTAPDEDEPAVSSPVASVPDEDDDDEPVLAGVEPVMSLDGADDDEDLVLDEDSDPAAAAGEATSDVDATGEDDDDDAEEEPDVDEDDEDDDEPETDVEAAASEDDVAVSEDDVATDEEDDDAEEDDEDDDAEEEPKTAETVVEAIADETGIVAMVAEGAVAAGAVAPAKDDLELRQGGGRRRRRRRRKGGPANAEPAPAPQKAEAKGRGGDASKGRGDAKGRGAKGRDGRGGNRNDRNARGGNRNDRDKNGRRKDSRISRSVPITEVVKEGDEVVVQISKEPIGTKGARVTSHVSLPGRHVVYLPTVEHIGVSKRIGSSRERSRLREVIDAIKPPKGGLIVRTVAEGLTKKQLKNDIGYLVKVWEETSRRHEGARSPTILYTELDLVLKVARDLFTDEIEKIVIDDREQYGRLVRFIEMFMPERAGHIELYQGDEPIFDAYGIEDEIGRALSRKVPLPSGGYLIIDQAEALAAIDVNTGRFVGKGSRDLEETALKTNLEAVDEIAYQLRFRNIGGLVILDLIDMERHSNRESVWRALEHKLAKDKAKTTLNRISELGLVEMTRKRTRESLGRVLHEPCFYCDGTGQIQSRATIAYEILRQIRRDRGSLPGYSVLVNAHPAVVDFMQTEEKQAVEEAGRRFQRRIILSPRPEYHIEQFDLQGK